MARSDDTTYRRIRDAVLKGRVPPSADLDEYWPKWGDPIEAPTLLEAYKKNGIAMQALDRYRDARDRQTRASTRGSSKAKQELLHDPPRRRGRPRKHKIEEETDDDADILAKPTPPKKGKTTPAKTTPVKKAPAKTTPAKTTPAKGKGKETDVEPDSTTETITLTAAELGAYCEEAYRAGRHTLMIANNLLVDLRQLMGIIEDMKAPTTRWSEQGRDTVMARIHAARYPNHLMKAEVFFRGSAPEPKYHELPPIIDGPTIRAIRSYVHKRLGEVVDEPLVDFHQVPQQQAQQEQAQQEQDVISTIEHGDEGEGHDDGDEDEGHDDGDAGYTEGGYVKTVYTVPPGYILTSKGRLKDEVTGEKVDHPRGYARTTDGGWISDSDESDD